MLNPNQYGQCLTLIIIEKRSVTHVTMLAKYNDNRELKQQRCEGNENYQKIDRFLLAKQQLGKYITLFCTFFLRRCTAAT